MQRNTITIHDKQGTRTIPYSYETPQLPTPYEPVRRVVEQELPPVMIEAALQAQPGADERTSSMNRAIALVIRLVPFSIIWLVLSIAAAHVLTWDLPTAFLLFSVLTAATYIVMDRQEYQFSNHGVERYRIDAAKELKMVELTHTAQMRRMAIESYLKLLERTTHE